jgi:hypothetical protein
MNTFTQTDCCTLLGIDPKTLRNWLRQADIQWSAHPGDARLKCLTSEQVQQLAHLHDRPLSSTLLASLPQPNEARFPCVQKESDALADLNQALVRLQAQVTTMQEQLTGLALELLRERELRLQWFGERTLHTEQRLATLETLLTPAELPSSPPQAETLPDAKDLSPLPPDATHRGGTPEVARSRRGMLPLIAYTATGCYVVICPIKGELPLVPDSPEWFDWLATLHSFRFLGQQGRLSTSRSSSRKSWMAYRRIHGRRYEYSLGSTKLLTIAHLEQMAATLQSSVPSLS